MTVVKNFFTYKAQSMSPEELREDAISSAIDVIELINRKGVQRSDGLRLFTDPDKTFQITVTSKRLEVVSAEGEDKGHGLLMVKLGKNMTPVTHIPGPWQVRIRNLLD